VNVAVHGEEVFIRYDDDGYLFADGDVDGYCVIEGESAFDRFAGAEAGELDLASVLIVEHVLKSLAEED